jgi:mannose-1-phosphate guanylyltransferase
VTGGDLADEVGRQLRAIDANATVIVEPVGRNTAPAIAVAAHRVIERDPDAVMAVLPADHVIAKSDAFLRCLAKAEEVAREGFLVTIGLVPRRAETGYGYIQRGEPLEFNSPTGDVSSSRVSIVPGVPGRALRRETRPGRRRALRRRGRLFLERRHVHLAGSGDPR